MATQTVEQFEAASRRYCEETGQNPDELVAIHGDIRNGTMTLAYRTQPLWRAVASQMQGLSLMLKCIGES